ncbi:unnamed protein product [Parnassius mnemosyne]|uniref:Uncharacterized protein n=1 Tax=Parnassius mnemosyne TaxID=213953 RepID=A0AAV1LUG3_9NEOP
MSVQRTPPTTTPRENNLQQQSDVGAGMGPQAEALMDTQYEHTPSSYVLIRNNRRPREDEFSPSQFLDFKQEMTRLITSFITEQKNSHMEITNTLKTLQQTTSNIEQCVSLLTLQNEEFQKKIDKLETQSEAQVHQLLQQK